MDTRSQRTILLAEDDPQIRQLICAVLADQDYIVYKAGNATEALAIFERRSQEIDLLITDVEMGEPMDGFGLAGKIRQDSPGTAVVVISGLPESARQAARLGLRFLAKPFSLAAFGQEIRTALDTATLKRTSAPSPAPAAPSNATSIRQDLLDRMHEAKNAYRDATARTAGLIAHAKDIGLGRIDTAYGLGAAIGSERFALAKFSQSVSAVRASLGPNRNPDRRQLLATILDSAIEAAHARKGFIHIFDRAENALVLEAQRGFEQEALTAFERVRDETCACGCALRTGRRAVIEDIVASPIFRRGPFRAILLAAGVRAVQSTPLFCPPGSLAGTLTTHYAEPTRPSQRELESIDGLCAQAAALIAGARGSARSSA